MPVEKSAGAVVFREENGKIYYLLLNYSAIGKVEKTYWGFSKGRVETGEGEIETVKREIKEETGIEDAQLIAGFKKTEKYFFKFQGKNILKFATFYLVKTNTREIQLSSEHVGYKWLTYQEAIEQLTFKNSKEILEKANNFLLTKERKYGKKRL